MIIPPTSSRVVDFIPRRRTEANLQAEFFAQAKARGLQVFLEYPSRWNESPGTRFDAVIHQAKKIRALCEIKTTKDKERRMETWPTTRQGKLYLSWGLPVFLILDCQDFLDVWAWAQSEGLIQPS